MSQDSTPAGFKPYIPASANLPEMTPRALIMGILLGMVSVSYTHLTLPTILLV